MDPKRNGGTLPEVSEQDAGATHLLLPTLGGVMELNYHGGGCRVGVRGEPAWFVSRQGEVTAELLDMLAGAELGAADSLRQGPVEVLARAMRGQFCLHASAVLMNGAAVVAFVGESGVGKSTLARLIQEATAGKWLRVADDVLPLHLAGRGVVVDPFFPQPKLQPHEQFVRPSDSGPLILTAVCLLEPAAGDGTVRLQRTRGVEAVAIVAGNTMGARLFDRQLLDAHLSFSAAVAATVQVYRLQFPRQLSVAPQVIARIAADAELGAHAGAAAYGG